jgi:leucine dehydrogenase
MVFAHPSFAGHEAVVHAHDPATGLRAVIAVHDTTLGPALGGCRMHAYPSEDAALDDVLRLSRAMTRKNALAGLALGGGKAVILGDPARDKTPALLRAFARAVDRLGGSYVTAEDVGIGVADAAAMRAVTRHVRGLPEAGPGDPAPYTARGVFLGMGAAVARRLGGGVEGRRVAVQGLGAVGMNLCALLHGAGARLVVADVAADRVADAVRRFGAEAADPATVHAADADVFAPCALGGVLDAARIPEIRAAVVAGAANTQLAAEDDARRLADRGILHAPDFVINAGGVIAIAYEGPDFDEAEVAAHIDRIPRTLERILAASQESGLPPVEVADRMAAEILSRARARRDGEG